MIGVHLVRILVITPIEHIGGVRQILESIGVVDYLDDPSPSDVRAIISNYEAIFTNPNKSKVYLGEEILSGAKKLRAICTPSTGTNHIDLVYASTRGWSVIALKDERELITQISSTAELALALTLSAIRNLVPSHNAAMKGEWDYTKYIGRQMNFLSIGVIGYGRLGQMYSRYCKAFGSRILVYDPYTEVEDLDFEQTSDLDQLLRTSDVISIHVHPSAQTADLLNATKFKKMKAEVFIINTSRGEVINEKDLVEFLKNNPAARAGVDVLTNEVKERHSSPLLNFAKTSQQVIVTQHIGGMTREAQNLAYGHAAKMLRNFFEDNRS